jgi:hypothetical protein
LYERVKAVVMVVLVVKLCEDGTMILSLSSSALVGVL